MERTISLRFIDITLIKKITSLMGPVWSKYAILGENVPIWPKWRHISQCRENCTKFLIKVGRFISVMFIDINLVKNVFNAENLVKFVILCKTGQNSVGVN